MRTLTEMQKETGCRYRDIYRVIIANKLTPVHYENRQRYYADITVNFIYKILYFERKLNIVTIESKMNKPEKQEPFEDFKKRTYGRK